MVRSGKLPPLPSRISPSLKTAIRAMLNLNVSDASVLVLTAVACPPSLDQGLVGDG
jgi:hypothetical protein